MDKGLLIRSRLVQLITFKHLYRPLLAAILLTPCWSYSAEPSPVLLGAYTVNTQMIMPNLEENLRYANSTVHLCISNFNPDQFFPILKHQSLSGCTLALQTSPETDRRYRLNCPGTNQTLGSARLTLGKQQLAGLINIRMGGKNMTFSQRIVANKVQAANDNCALDKT